MGIKPRFKIDTAASGDSGESIEIQVHPKILNIRRVKNLKGIAAVPFPVNDIAKMGVTTTDFREIRKLHIRRSDQEH